MPDAPGSPESTAGEAPARVAALEARLRSAGDVARLGTWTWDLDDGTLEWSETMHALVGQGRAPSIESFGEIVHPADRAEYWRIVREVRGGASTLGPFSLRIRRPDGDVRWLLGSVTPVRGDGPARRVAGAVDDVTDELVSAAGLRILHAAAHGLRAWRDGGTRDDLLAAMAAQDLETAAIVLWTPAPEETALRRAALWHAPGLATSDLEAAVGHVGSPTLERAWREGRPWVLDLDEPPARDERAGLAAATGGARTALLLPIVRAGRTAAVVEILTAARLPDDPRLLDTLSELGESMGASMSLHGLDPAGSPLTARESAVLQCAAQGMSSGAIARSLELSASTVKTHFEKVYAKLGVHDRGEAVAEGLRRGLIV